MVRTVSTSRREGGRARGELAGREGVIADSQIYTVPLMFGPDDEIRGPSVLFKGPRL